MRTCKCEGAGIIYYLLLTESWWKVISQMDKRHIGSEKVRDFRICALNFPLQYNQHWDSRTKPIDRAIVQEVRPASPDLNHIHIQVLAKFSSRMSEFGWKGLHGLQRLIYCHFHHDGVSARRLSSGLKGRIKENVKDREIIIETGQRRDNHKEEGTNRDLV